MAHCKPHWLQKALSPPEVQVLLVGRALASLLFAGVLSSGFASVSNAAVPLGNVAPTCVGDCDGSGAVTVDEILNGVSIALGTLPVVQCPALDCNGTGRVTVDCITTAVAAALQGCAPAPTSSVASVTATFGGAATRTATAALTSTPSSTRTSTASRTSTRSPTRPPGDEAAVAASVRIATEPFFQLLDFQARVGTPGGLAGHPVVSGCQQFDCVAFGHVTGIEEDCCSDRQFTQFFDNCAFDDDLGRVVRLNGSFVLNTDDVDVCTGAIPRGSSFAAFLSGFTRDVFFPDGGFSRTFQELTETFEEAPGGCAVSQPNPFGLGIRGDGLRFISGELQQFQSDSSGNVLLDIQSDVDALEIAVGSTGQPDACTVAATLRGSTTNADFGAGTQFATKFVDFDVVQLPQAGALILELNGTVGTDCLGEVQLSTVEPLRIARADNCFTAGRLQAELGDGTASVTYTESAGLDFDFGADGSVDQHFATCRDVSADKCGAKLVGLCGACTALNECQTGLGCFPCSRDCSGNTSRCTLSDTFATCKDGVF